MTLPPVTDTEDPSIPIAPPEASPDPGTLTDRARWRILAVLLVTIFMSLVNVSTVNVALPTIQHGLGASQSDLQWVLSGYALTFGVILVAAGRAGDIVGRGGLFIAGTLVFTLASVVCGLAPDPASLNVARFVQGIGSGLINPQGIGMIQQYFRGAERGRAFGYFGSMVGVAVGVGPVLGGLLIELGGTEFGWRLAFLFNAPIGVLVMVLGWRWFPRPLLGWATRSAGHRDDPGGRWRHLIASLDPIGSLLLGLAVFSVLYPFMEYRASAATWLLIPAGLALTVVWVLWERHYARSGRAPMVDLDIFRTHSFTNGAGLMALYFFGMTSIWVIVALYFQEGSGKSALEAGLVNVPSALLSAVAAHWAGKRVMQYGRTIVIGGLLLGITGLLLCLLVVWAHERLDISVWWLALSLCLIGLAQGSVISPNQTLTLAEVPLRYAGSSGAVMQTGQRMGTSMGIAIITSALFAVLGARSSWSDAVTVAFALVALAFVLALAIGLKDMRDRGRMASMGVTGIAS